MGFVRASFDYTHVLSKMKIQRSGSDECQCSDSVSTHAGETYLSGPATLTMSAPPHSNQPVMLEQANAIEQAERSPVGEICS